MWFFLTNQRPRWHSISSRLTKITFKRYTVLMLLTSELTAWSVEKDSWQTNLSTSSFNLPKTRLHFVNYPSTFQGGPSPQGSDFPGVLIYMYRSWAPTAEYRQWRTYCSLTHVSPRLIPNVLAEWMFCVGSSMSLRITVSIFYYVKHEYVLNFILGKCILHDYHLKKLFRLKDMGWLHIMFWVRNILVCQPEEHI